jgi:hypothetical protein
MTRRLSHVYMTQALALRNRGRAAASRAFLALPAVDDDHFEEWLDDVRPITNGTSSASASLAQAFVYASAAVVVRHVLNPADYTQEQIGVSSFADRYRDPFIGFYGALGKGQSFEDALAVGASRAGLVVDSDAQWAATTMMGDAAGRVEAESDKRVRGFVRVPEADACAFCQDAADRTYTTDDLDPLHAGCGCGVEPLIA